MKIFVLPMLKKNSTYPLLWPFTKMLVRYKPKFILLMLACLSNGYFLSFPNTEARGIVGPKG
jgi:hypothetical protein